MKSREGFCRAYKATIKNELCLEIINGNVLNLPIPQKWCINPRVATQNQRIEIRIHLQKRKNSTAFLPDLEFVKKFTRPNFRAKEFYTLKMRKSRLLSPAINSKNASLSVIWPSFG